MAYTTVGVTSEAVRFGSGALEYHVASFDESRVIGSARRHGGVWTMGPDTGLVRQIERQGVRTQMHG